MFALARSVMLGAFFFQGTASLVRFCRSTGLGAPGYSLSSGESKKAPGSDPLEAFFTRLCSNSELLNPYWRKDSASETQILERRVPRVSSKIPLTLTPQMKLRERTLC